MTPRVIFFGLFFMFGTVALGGFSIPFWRWFHDLCASDTAAAEITTTTMIMGFGGILTAVIGRACPHATAWICGIPMAPQTPIAAPKRARVSRSRSVPRLDYSKR